MDENSRRGELGKPASIQVPVRPLALLRYSVPGSCVSFQHGSPIVVAVVSRQGGNNALAQPIRIPFDALEEIARGWLCSVIVSGLEDETEKSGGFRDSHDRGYHGAVAMTPKHYPI